jgi:peptidyl-prolyl cis-trans isomerase A (cyclophilin A)
MLNRTALVLCSFSLLAAGQTAPAPAPASKQAASKTVAAAAMTRAILHTTAGDMKCELFPDKTPKTVANFIGLAQGTKDWKDPGTGQVVHGRPLYDGVIFHRVIPQFMVQTGDPSGTGAGDVGFEFENEPRADLLYDRPGRMGMANRGPNTNSSQFFITEVPFPSLNGGYTIFGQCDAAAVELVKKIASGPCRGGMPCTNQNSRPQTPVKITHIQILGAPDTASQKSPTKKPAAQSKTPPQN